MTHSLTSRQQAILSNVVETHIETAQPVGSRFMAERYRVSCSSATIRHEMGLLEEDGYLMHPHTSSGRVPTDLGYRYYVDHTMQEDDFPVDFFERVRADLEKASEQMEEPERVAEEASRTLSALAREIGMVVFPDQGNRLRLYVQGSVTMLDKPEFRDLDKLRNLLSAIESRQELMSWLQGKDGTHGTVSVFIGEENDHDALRECSVICTPYGVDDTTIGTLAIVGPRRLRYSRMVPLAARMAEIVGEVLDAGFLGDRS
ncbi:MAG: hypothetical protein Q8R76_08870 [Candidatus Omnitrophota bacterium]|nr:hypothetical protein [Candidatus Omnitrophota bacterium]